jgi:hypothetical protein
MLFSEFTTAERFAMLVFVDVLGRGRVAWTNPDCRERNRDLILLAEAKKVILNASRMSGKAESFL